MAKRPQFGVSTVNLYEDFQPLSEWKEEPGNSILVVHLPDFTKEQIHITCVRSSRIVRVTGERQLANNKWSRCNQAFQIPQNCKIDMIHAKWQNGTLTITTPNETITQPVVRKEEAKTTQEAPKAASEPKSPKDHQLAAASPKAADAKSTNDYQQAVSPKAADKEAKYWKDQQAGPGKAAASSIIENQNEVKKDASAKATSSIHGEKKTDGKNIDALSAKRSEKEDKLKKGDHQDDSNFPKAASTTTSTMKQMDKGSLVSLAENIDRMREKIREAIENVFTESKKPENVSEKTTQVKESAFPKTAGKEKEKEDKSAGEEKEKEKKDSIAEKTKEREKEDKSAGEEKEKEKKDSIAEKTKEKQSITADAMKAVKGLAVEQNEDKQLMINIGVAALVLAAFGAYVSYSFGSKSKH